MTENAKSHIPGTDANRQTRFDQGCEARYDSNCNRFTSDHDRDTGSTSRDNLMSYVQAHKPTESSRFCMIMTTPLAIGPLSDYDRNIGTNTGGGIASYTEASRISRAERVQDISHAHYNIQTWLPIAVL